MSEIIKISMMLDSILYEKLKKNNLDSLISDLETVKSIIASAVSLKKQIVEQDEKENNLRMVLNFGHTVGHAIEAEMSEINHGLCVSIGMYCEIEIARFMGRSEIDIEDFKGLLIQYKLPYKMPSLNIQNLFKKAKIDKKRRTLEIPIYVPQQIGELSLTPVLVEEEVFKMFLSNNIQVSGIGELNKVNIPGSKSLTNRYILLSALCNSKTIIDMFLNSEDTSLMINCLMQLGLGMVSRFNNNNSLVVEPCQ